MQYEQVWDAVDKLAKSQGLSPSGLAKKAGLDATTFNKSKRVRPDGKKRWPSLDSINKILEVSGITFDQFYAMMDSESAGLKLAPSIPFIKFSQLSKGSPLLKGKELLMTGWSKVRFPDSRDRLYAVDVDTGCYEPLYRCGTLIIVSKNSEIRRGDRILIIDKDGDISFREFVQRTTSSLEVNNLNGCGGESSLPLSSIKLVNRIVWASQ